MTIDCYLFSIPLSQEPLEMNDHHLRTLRYPRFDVMRRILSTLVAVFLNLARSKLLRDAILHSLPILGYCHRQCQLFVACVRFFVADSACALV